MLSLIIVNYNSLPQLKRCLLSVAQKLKGVEYEIIVVNNDEVGLELETDILFLKKIEVSRNIGFGAACNLGAEISVGKYLWFLNPDTEIISSDIEGLLEKFEQNPSFGIIGAQLLLENNLPQPWSFGKEITLWGTLENNILPEKIVADKPFLETDWVSGAALFVKKDLFERLGGFDEKFFMYFEDIDLCKRAANLSFKTGVYSLLQIKHAGGKSFTDKRVQKDHYYESQNRYFLKHRGKLHFFLLKFLRLFH